ncbi:MAG: NAD(P)/FAD-dependent oxidoreductase [Sterolibacterium sp.]|nr:NAD(P)/FAD-dependent oxidoreductase [Sterolibacterium sp.]
MQEQKNQTGASNKKSADVIVVGAGHNGLIAGCYMARAGLDVLVLEAYKTVGGMTCTNPFEPEAPDHLINECSCQASLFRFSPIDEELELTKKYGLRQRLMDPIHTHLSSEGDESIGMWRDPQQMAKEISYFSPKDGAAYIDFVNLLMQINHIGLPFALTNPARPDIGVVLKSIGRAVKGYKQIGKIANLLVSSQSGYLEECFEHDMTRAMFTSPLPFMPFKSDFSAWSLIYIGVLAKYGVAMFEGGTQGFPNALVRCLEAAGGQVRTNAEVAEMIMKNGRVAGVRLQNGDEIMATKAVMTAFSPKVVLNDLLPKGVLTNQQAVHARHIPTSDRGVADYKLNMAFKGKIIPRRHQAWRDKKYNDGNDLRLTSTQWMTYQQSLKAYEDCVRGEVPEVIGGLVQITTAFDAAMAPPGHDTLWFWSGLTPAEPREGWDIARDQITTRLIKNIGEYFDGVEELEIARRPLARPDLEKRFFAIGGSPYHVEPYITRQGPLKPMMGFGGYKTPVPGLYLSGSGTHPSAGISGISGRNAALTLLKESRKGSV